VPVCCGCGLRAFPPHLVCRRCGSLEWRQEPETDGIAEHVTCLRRRLLGLPGDRPVPLAVVMTGTGVRVVARTDASVRAGDPVALDVEDGAVVARPAAVGESAQPGAA
jgi:uncharacterized OB-fold protein